MFFLLKKSFLFLTDRRFSATLPPAYFILFTATTWYIHRPCLYCQLLLTILVISFYDWSVDWFVPHDQYWIPENGRQINRNYTAFVTRQRGNLAAIPPIISQKVRQGVSGRSISTISVGQWLRNMIGQREWHIPKLGIVLRL